MIQHLLVPGPDCCMIQRVLTQGHASYVTVPGAEAPTQPDTVIAMTTDASGMREIEMRCTARVLFGRVSDFAFPALGLPAGVGVPLQRLAIDCMTVRPQPSSSGYAFTEA